MKVKVADLMTKDPACCTPDSPLHEVARIMKLYDCGAVPVVGDLDSKFPIGIVTDRDIVTRVLADCVNPLGLTARDCMTAPAETVTEETDLDDCIELLEERQIRRVIVVDRTGRCSGIVAQADVASHASKRKAGELLQEVSRPADDARDLASRQH
jgi:CBS domain-containing protein